MCRLTCKGQCPSSDAPTWTDLHKVAFFKFPEVKTLELSLLFSDLASNQPLIHLILPFDGLETSQTLIYLFKKGYTLLTEAIILCHSG